MALDNALDNLLTDDIDAFVEPFDECIARNVDEARNTTGMLKHCRGRLFIEELPFLPRYDDFSTTLLHPTDRYGFSQRSFDERFNI